MRVVEWTPRETSARLRQELRAIHSKPGTADHRLGVDHSIGEGVVGGAAVRFIPSVGRFVTKADGEGEPGTEAHRIFDKPGAEPGSPTNLGRRRIEQQRCDGSLQQRLQTGEGRLAILTERHQFIALETLEPYTGGDLMTAMSPREVIFISEKI